MPPVRPATLRRYAVTVVAAGALTAALFMTFGDTSDASADANTAPDVRRVAVAAVADAPASRRYTAFGVTASADRSMISFAQPGRVMERPVSVGDDVEAGDVIATLDTEPLRNQERGAAAQIDDLEAQLEEVERERARAEQLVAAELGTGQAVDQLDTAAQRLEAALAGARVQQREAARQRREATLRAPFSGVITEAFVDAGEFAGPGTPIVLLTGTGGIEVEVELPEAVFVHVAEGDAVTAHFPMAETAPAAGTVVRAARAAVGRGELFPVVVSLTTESIAPGMSAEVYFALPEPAELAVPVGAVVDPTGGGASVWRVRGDAVERVSVVVERLEGDSALVTGALSVGDALIVAGHSGLQDGDTVEVVR